DDITLQQRSEQQQQQQRFLVQCEALFPNLTTYLLTCNHWTIAARISNDDCEIIRLINEVLYRRYMESQRLSQDVTSSSASSEATAVAQTIIGINDNRIRGVPATFEDYCAMQSNELAQFRQQLELDMEEMEPRDLYSVQEDSTTEEGDDYSRLMTQWRQLLSLLPSHLLGCFYIYMRMRDAYLLLTQEGNEGIYSTPPPYLDNVLFRTILFAEVANSFGIRDGSEELLGFAVFPRACFFNHSCRPNIDKRRHQGNKTRQMEYWSTRVIEADEECCISYGDISKGREERQERLEDIAMNM
ncbi:hypothetical protein BGZ65_001594, partial [Modicella reniformis]